MLRAKQEEDEQLNLLVESVSFLFKESKSFSSHQEAIDLRREKIMKGDGSHLPSGKHDESLSTSYQMLLVLMFETATSSLFIFLLKEMILIKCLKSQLNLLHVFEETISFHVSSHLTLNFFC